MRIIFVRHGHPDYRKDCLTELGHLHAAAAAERLANEGIEQIFSSTCGRAYETAEYTARKLGIPEIVKCDFMREVSWKSIDDSELPFGGHPWQTAGHMVTSGESLMDPAWKNKEPFCRNIVSELVETKAKCFDELLKGLGYQREGYYYRVQTSNDTTIAMFSHGGSSAAVLSHLLNLPFPFMCEAMPPDYTAVTVITISGEVGSLVSPKVELFNDARHIAGISLDPAETILTKEKVFSL